MVIIMKHGTSTERIEALAHELEVKGLKVGITNGVGCSILGLVGDTMTDIRFARNAGLKAIAVGKHAENRSRLQAYADGVLHDVSELPGILE